jgi:integrase
MILMALRTPNRSISARQVTSVDNSVVENPIVHVSASVDSAPSEIVPVNWTEDVEDEAALQYLHSLTPDTRLLHHNGPDVSAVQLGLDSTPAPWLEAAARWPMAASSQQLPEQVLAQLPPSIRNAGPNASYRFFEFFTASIRNAHTRRAYGHAVGRFFSWCEGNRLPLEHINSVVVATYIETLPASAPTTKLHLAALRRLFDHLVVGQVLPINPAAAVRGPRHSVRKGKTPVLNGEEAQHLLDSIDVSHLIGLRDRAIIGLMIYSFARIGAVVRMNVGDYYGSGKRWWVRLHEKGGKFHEVPVHHIAEEYLDAYISAASIAEEKKAPLFRTTRGRSRTLTANRYQENDAFRMIRRRALAVDVSPLIGCHTCRATGITAYLSHGGTLERAQQIANHESPKTTKLYDRSNDQLTVDEIERIRLD